MATYMTSKHPWADCVLKVACVVSVPIERERYDPFLAFDRQKIGATAKNGSLGRGSGEQGR